MMLDPVCQRSLARLMDREYLPVKQCTVLRETATAESQSFGASAISVV